MALKLYQGRRWHLHGWCHKHQVIRTFTLEAIQEFRLLPSAFERNEAAWRAFRGQEGVVGGLRMGSPIPVKVRFTEEVATLALRSRWPTGLAVQEEAEGSVLLSGTALGTEGILVELLRWRRHAQVLGGEETTCRFSRRVTRDDYALSGKINYIYFPVCHTVGIVVLV